MKEGCHQIPRPALVRFRTYGIMVQFPTRALHLSIILEKVKISRDKIGVFWLFRQSFKKIQKGLNFSLTKEYLSPQRRIATGCPAL